MRKPPSESLLSAQMYPGHRIMKVLNRTSVAVKIRTRKKKTRGDDSSSNANVAALPLPGKSASHAKCNSVEVFQIAPERRSMPWQNQSSSRGASMRRLAVLGPLVLAADLVLLLGSEVVLNVERLANLLGGLALDHVCDSLDVHVVGGEDDLEEHLLVDLHELLVPLFNVGGLLAGVGVVVLGGRRVVLVL
jgi:hypothetical protein